MDNGANPRLVDSFPGWLVSSPENPEAGLEWDGQHAEQYPSSGADLSTTGCFQQAPSLTNFANHSAKLCAD